LVALESGAAQAVASFEVADASLGADAVAGQAARAALVGDGSAAGDVNGGQVGQRGVAGGGVKAAVERDLARAPGQPLQFAGGSLKQRVSLGLPIWLEAGRSRPRAPRRVFWVSSVSQKT
jgi:hypothetical protein